MITLKEIKDNLPLEQFLNEPEKLTFFQEQPEKAFFDDLCQVWQQKNYWSFLLSMGPFIELIGYSAIDYAKLALYQAAGKETDLKQTAQGFFSSERESRDTFQGLVDAVRVKRYKFILSDFQQNQWTVPQNFNFVLRQTLDEGARYRLTNNLEIIQKLRNSISHGNIMQFMRDFSPVKGRLAPASHIHFEIGDDGEIKAGEPEYKLMPLEETTPTFVYLFLVNAFRDDSPLPVKHEIAKLFVETSFMLALLISHMETSDVIKAMLGNLK
ncbi:hypothetical protein BH10CHL1_BH10CHL1_06520 [soil metagenome]